MPDHPATVTARVVHVLPGRVRLRISGLRGSELLSLRDRIASVPGVMDVQATPRTGSVLIRGDAVSLSTLEVASRHSGLQLMTEREPQRPLNEYLLDRFDAVDKRLLQATGRRLDLASVAVLALFGTAAVQMMRGQFSAPAITILWYAASTVLMARSIRRTD